MILVLFFLIGSGLVVAPWFVPELNNGGRIASLSVGVIVLTVVAIAAVITKLYRKASANMAFVRTGMGGVKVIRDKGSVVVPVLHQVIPVSLETMRLNVERRGPHALITHDNLRVDLSAEFWVEETSSRRRSASSCRRSWSARCARWRRRRISSSFTPSAMNSPVPCRKSSRTTWRATA
jgi:hypothetical protein